MQFKSLASRQMWPPRTKAQERHSIKMLSIRNCLLYGVSGSAGAAHNAFSLPVASLCSWEIELMTNNQCFSDGEIINQMKSAAIPALLVGCIGKIKAKCVNTGSLTKRFTHISNE